jgi:hypothetical protein
MSDRVGADKTHFAILVFSSFSCLTSSHGMGARSRSSYILSSWVGRNVWDVGVVTATTTPLATSSILISFASASSSVALAVALGLRIGGCYSSVVTLLGWSHGERFKVARS